MLTIDNLSASSAASLAFDEATNCTIAFGRFVYFLSCLAYAAGQEFRSYCDNELIAHIERAIGIVQWLIHWLETADATANSIYALPLVSNAPTASVAIEPEQVATLAEPTVSVRDEAVADTPETTKPAASTTPKRRTTASKSKAQAKSTTSSRSKTKRSTT